MQPVCTNALGGSTAHPETFCFFLANDILTTTLSLPSWIFTIFLSLSLPEYVALIKYIYLQLNPNSFLCLLDKCFPESPFSATQFQPQRSNFLVFVPVLFSGDQKSFFRWRNSYWRRRKCSSWVQKTSMTIFGQIKKCHHWYIYIRIYLLVL